MGCKDLAVVSSFKSSPVLLGAKGDDFELSDDRQEYDGMEGSGRDNALSMKGGLVTGEFAGESSPRFKAETALRRGDFAGVGGLIFSVFSGVEDGLAGVLDL